MTAYEEFLRMRPQHEAVPYVKYRIATAYFVQYGGVAKDQTPLRSALEHYRRLVKDHPGSSYGALARQRIREAREKLAEHELYVAEFYLQRDQRKAGAHRFKELLEHYPETEAARSARVRIEKHFAEEPELHRYIFSGKTHTHRQELAERLRPSAPSVVRQASAPGERMTRTRSRLSSALERGASRIADKATTPEGAASAAMTGVTEVGTARRSSGPALQIDLHCERAGRALVLRSMFSNPLPVIRAQVLRDQVLRKQPRREQLLVRLNDGGDITESALPEKRSCEVAGSTLEVRAGPQGPELLLSIPKGDEHKLLTLDRPYRVIAVVFPAESS